MPIAESLLSEFDQETARSRKILDRCPFEKFNWKPHEKSWPLGRLAAHLVGVAKWGLMTVESDEFNFQPGQYVESAPPSTAELLSTFDSDSKAFREKLLSLDDEAFARPWSLKAGGKPIFTAPKGEVLRTYVFNHAIHHRAQLGVYLRLLDIPVPAIYGPSADDDGG